MFDYKSQKDVQEVCSFSQHSLLNQRTLGCAWTTKIDGVDFCHITIQHDLPTDVLKEVVVHEVCHCWIQSQGLPDSCHDSDGGKINIR